MEPNDYIRRCIQYPAIDAEISLEPHGLMEVPDTYLIVGATNFFLSKMSKIVKNNILNGNLIII